ncbi:uncharacterized protein LOC134241489 [Saccostrea cucullata]|uniref:uncharacterized protein LOC134241489 n=1 Tax=Saccostrea cuccullata TaxID=36930 RepID=UPI002ED5BD6E
MVDQNYFSALTDDEVSVLFCFLCSDSGPPDFTDTEWLDLLSKIRQQVFTKYANVTREEAHQTLDRLKSRDYLWEDQDNINETTKDETMYKIASNKSDLPFIYSSYNTGSVYLRSRQSSRKPGEKCVMSDRSYCDDLLILRLQMNILTHVTMEDTGMYYKIHQILNVPVNILSENEDKRRDFLTVQKRGGDAVHLRGRSHNSVDHVTWLWRYERWARPNIVRSCIGLHPHLDIYIIDNKPYRKPNQYHKYKPSVKWLLYGVLLVDQFTLDVNNESHKEVLNILRERYFTELTLYGEIIVPNIPSEITNIRDNRITFISDDIRHDVMYAFVTECLVEDSDLEFFLTTASRDVISEYCRSWEYKRSKGERCLYVPDEPEKMYDLFIDKLQLDIISHCTLSDERIHDRISIRRKYL